MQLNNKRLLSPSPAGASQLSAQNYFINQINISNVANRLKTADSEVSKHRRKNKTIHSGSIDVSSKHGVSMDKGRHPSSRLEGSHKKSKASGLGWFGYPLSINSSFAACNKGNLKFALPARQSSKKIDIKKMCEAVAKSHYNKQAPRLESSQKLSGIGTKMASNRFSLMKKMGPAKLSNILMTFKTKQNEEKQEKITRGHKRHSSFDIGTNDLKRSLRENSFKHKKSSRNKSLEFSCKYIIPKRTTQWPKISYSVRTRKGKSGSNSDKVNQDSFLIQPRFMNHQDVYLFGIYDGHGENGHLVSNYISSNLPGIIKTKSSNTLDKVSAQAIHDSYQELFEQLYAGDIDIGYSGSTAVTCLIKSSKLLTANSGDSRAIVAYLDKFGKISHQSLSKDHKPDCKFEAERILQSGGRIEPCRQADGQSLGPSRVWLAQDDVPGLAMSRAIGDLVACSVGVTWQPEISEYSISEADKFILLASDGVFEHLSNKTLVNAIWSYYKKQDIEGACDEIMKIALKSWKKYQQIDVDDITFILVFIE